MPKLPYGYKLSALVMAYNIEKATGTVVLNPFILQPKSLMEVDMTWLQARSRFYQWLEYAEDMEKSKGKVQT